MEILLVVGAFPQGDGMEPQFVEGEGVILSQPEPSRRSVSAAPNKIRLEFFFEVIQTMAESKQPRLADGFGDVEDTHLLTNLLQFDSK